MTNRRDDGSASTYFAVLAVSVLFAAGLALSGARKLAAAVEVREVADNAARACAQQIDPASVLGGGQPRVDPAAGTSAAAGFANGAALSTSVSGTVCTVSASKSVQFWLIPGGATVSGVGVADALED